MVNALAPQSLSTPRQACVNLQLGERAFGLPMLLVRDVTRRPPIATVPLAPVCIAGITHMRGRMVTVVDLRRLLGMTGHAPQEKQVMAVVEYQGELYGLLADMVNDVVSLDTQTRQALPENFSAAWRSIAGAVYSLPKGGDFTELDLDKLIAALK